MPSTQKEKPYCPLWRVTVNGAVFELRAKTIEGAITSAMRQDVNARMLAAGESHETVHMLRSGIRSHRTDEDREKLHSYDWADAVITCERIGEPEVQRPRVETTMPGTPSSRVLSLADIIDSASWTKE